MPAVRVQEKVRPIDWLQCFLGLISCDFNGKNKHHSSSLDAVTLPLIPVISNSPEVVPAFHVCGGSANVHTLSIEGCTSHEDGTSAKCLLPYGDVAQLRLTYTPAAEHRPKAADFGLSLNGIHSDQAPNHHHSVVDDEPITITYEMQFGEDMIGQDVSVQVNVHEEEDLMLCAAMDVIVVAPESASDNAAPATVDDETEDASFSSREGWKKQFRKQRKQQPMMAEDL